MPKKAVETTMEVSHNGHTTGPIPVDEFMRRVDNVLDGKPPTEMLRIYPAIRGLSLVSRPIVVKGHIIGTAHSLVIGLEWSALEKQPLSDAQDILSSLRLLPEDARAYVAFGTEQVPLDLDEGREDEERITTGQTQLEAEEEDEAEEEPDQAEPFDDGDPIPDCDLPLHWNQPSNLEHLGAFLRSQGYHTHKPENGEPAPIWHLGTPDGVEVLLDITVIDGMTWHDLQQHLGGLRPEG
jgi:hypothetical protein